MGLLLRQMTVTRSFPPGRWPYGSRSVEAPIQAAPRRGSQGWTSGEENPVTHQDDSREREAAEMALGGVRDAFAWAPEESPTWLACRALLPDFQWRVEALGGQCRPQPEDAQLPPRSPS